MKLVIVCGKLMHFFILFSKCDNNGFSMYYETEMYNIEQTNRGRKFNFIINGFVCVTIDYIYVTCCSSLSVLQLTTYMFRVAQLCLCYNWLHICSVLLSFVCATIDHMYVPCCSALPVLQLTTHMFRVAQLCLCYNWPHICSVLLNL
jgi:hypothetical protein